MWAWLRRKLRLTEVATHTALVASAGHQRTRHTQVLAKLDAMETAASERQAALLSRLNVIADELATLNKVLTNAHLTSKPQPFVTDDLSWETVQAINLAALNSLPPEKDEES